MDQSSELLRRFEELEKLRSSFLRMHDSCNVLPLKIATELAQRQVSCLKTTNGFINNLLSNSAVLKERLEAEDKSISMPNRGSALNLIASAKAALKIHEELVLGKDTLFTVDEDKNLFEGEKPKFNSFCYKNMSNHELNRSIWTMINYYTGSLDREEFDDSTVNTIVSEDVLASSPI